MIEAAQIFFGILFFMFLPGWLAVQIFLKDLRFLEKILLSIIFSIMIGLVIGVFFGYDRAQAQLTGGFTETNIWLGEIAVTILLGIILLIKTKFNNARKNQKENEPKRKLRKPKKK